MSSIRGAITSSIVVLMMLISLCVRPVFGEDDIECLRAVSASLMDRTQYLSNWNFHNTTKGFICSFIGVQCWHQQENKVFSLKLPGAGLAGSFPKGLENCSSLQQIDFSSNQLSGPLPDNLCKSEGRYLTNINLSSNAFNGSIPSNIASCSYLNELYLQNNRFTGYIPGQIGLLPRLHNLNLSNNDLLGEIPVTLVNRSSVNQNGFDASTFQGNPKLCGKPLAHRSVLPALKILVPVIAAVAAAVTFSLFVSGFVASRIYTGRRRAIMRDENQWARRVKAPKSTIVSLFGVSSRKMRMSDLMAATNSFSKDNIIGFGRTGTVYKATLSDGSAMSIKRLCASVRSDKEFKSEMITLGQLKHSNLVPLLGYCIAGKEKLLVYKHMVNGSLKDCLHSVANETRLQWPTRLKIAVGAARGLAWLHHSCNPRILHRNISASSILIDIEYEPRITDFGLARLMNPVDTHVSTVLNGDFGDIGYVAPEYLRTLVATVKGDVYSFGIILLELVTSQKPANVCVSGGDFKGTLADWITSLSSKGCVQEAIDPSLTGNEHDEELVQVLKIARACVISAPKERPTMYEVYHILRSVAQKYNFTDETDEMPMTVTCDEDCGDELIVARESQYQN